MPVFDFLCLNCGEKIDLIISSADKKKVLCLECKYSDIKQLISLFNTGGTGKNLLVARDAVQV